MQFLLEVFGTDYYLTVLDIIYHNQRLNADGSPVTGDSYAWELYHMLLQLSLIKTRQGKDENADPANPQVRKDEISRIQPHRPSKETYRASFGEWLERIRNCPKVPRRTFLRRLVKRNRNCWYGGWKHNLNDDISLLADLMDEPSVLLLNGHVSLQLSGGGFLPCPKYSTGLPRPSPG